jgi:hypothetical protein
MVSAIKYQAFDRIESAISIFVIDVVFVTLSFISAMSNWGTNFLAPVCCQANHQIETDHYSSSWQSTTLDLGIQANSSTSYRFDCQNVHSDHDRQNIL